MRDFKNYAQGAELLRQFPEKSIERWVLANGTAMAVDIVPQGKRGLPKMCFMNAAKAAIADADLTYVEGIVMIPIPILHAWVWDARIGRGLELTLSRNVGYEYIGVPFKRDFLLETIAKTKMYGLLDNWRDVASKLIGGKIAAAEVVHRIT